MCLPVYPYPGVKGQNGAETGRERKKTQWKQEQNIAKIRYVLFGMALFNLLTLQYLKIPKTIQYTNASFIKKYEI
jgi:hypothetical protein